MSVDADTVRRVAHLARLAVAEDEVEHLRGELNAILAFVEQLAEAEVDGDGGLPGKSANGDRSAAGLSGELRPRLSR